MISMKLSVHNCVFILAIIENESVGMRKMACDDNLTQDRERQCYYNLVFKSRIYLTIQKLRFYSDKYYDLNLL